MKPRTVLIAVVGLLVSIALVFFASNLQAGTGSSLAEMMTAQRHTPLLWVVDACAAGFLAGICWYAVMLEQFQSFVDGQATQHLEQLNDMIERTSNLEQVNDSYADRIEQLEAELARQFRDLADQVATLEAAADTRRQVFEVEARRISEQAHHLFETQLEHNTRQLEALSAALRFQRGDLRRLSHESGELQHELSPQLSLRVASSEFTDIHGNSMSLALAPMAIAPSMFRETGQPAGHPLYEDQPVDMAPNSAMPVRDAGAGSVGHSTASGTDGPGSDERIVANVDRTHWTGEDQRYSPAPGATA